MVDPDLAHPLEIPPLFRRLLLLGLLNSPVLAEQTATVDFNRDVRPILSDNCFYCHGPDPEHREAGLRLDLRDDAIEYGAITPSEVDASELVARIFDTDEDVIMPPPNSHKTLTDRQKQVLRDWIDQGAEYAEHWAFAPRIRPQIPATAKHPVDAFVIDRLRQEADATISPPADPHRLVRRLHLDLLGIPPTWDQTTAFVQAFEKDADAAVEAKIEELLANRHHGERMASFWLDVVRYADTVGYHGDQNHNVFPYRDWVVDAFNENLPFDKFTEMQIAGDLLPGEEADDLTASGFNRLGMVTREGGAQPGEYLTKYAADRVRTVGMAWMGLTTGCAECHDHKFDPIKAKDFYSLGAFFADVQQWGVYSDYGYSPNTDLKGYRNEYPFPPEIEVVSPAVRREQNQARAELVEIARRGPGEALKAMPNADAFLALARDWLGQFPTGWRTLAVTESTGPADKKDSEKEVRRRVNLSPGHTPIQSVRVTLPAQDDAKSCGVKLAFEVHGSDGKTRDVPIYRADADRLIPNFDAGGIELDIASRWTLPATDSQGRPRRQFPLEPLIDRSVGGTAQPVAVFQFATPLTLAQGEELVMTFGGVEPVEEVDVSPIATLRPLDVVEIEGIATAQDSDSAAAALAWLLSVRHHHPDRRRIDDLITQYRNGRDGVTPTMVTRSVEPYPMRILPRGNWQDQTGQKVVPATPEFLGRFGMAEKVEEERHDDKTDDAKEADQRLTRLDLAHWLCHDDNPLTPRVVVNRLWKQFFGTGLSASADDFGAQGEPPSHPELLDYLANELVDSGWDQRHVIRLILTSGTYAQDSAARPEFAQSDPNNRLLSHHPPRRLEAEAVRDNALAIAGLLNRDIGGPAVRPYQPVGYYANLQFPDRDYVATAGEDQYRRGLYMHWQRTFLHPMLANFDAPSREDCVAIRPTANTPQQALTLLNDPTFIEAAVHFAADVVGDFESDEALVVAMFRRTLQRDPSSEQVDSLCQFLAQQRIAFASDRSLIEQFAAVGQEPIDLTAIGDADVQVDWAATAALARVLLNLHETITRY